MCSNFFQIACISGALGFFFSARSADRSSVVIEGFLVQLIPNLSLLKPASHYKCKFVSFTGLVSTIFALFIIVLFVFISVLTTHNEL